MAKQIVLGDDARQGLPRGVNILSNACQGDARPPRQEHRPRQEVRLPHQSPRTASRWPRKSSSRTPSRTWAPSWPRKSPPRPTTSPATARPPPPSSAPPSSARASRTWPAGANPMGLKEGHRDGRRRLRRAPRSMAKPVTGKDQIAQVATISADDPEIGNMIAEVMEKVGKDGVITVEESRASAWRPSSWTACSSTAATPPPTS